MIGWIKVRHSSRFYQLCRLAASCSSCLIVNATLLHRDWNLPTTPTLNTFAPTHIEHTLVLVPDITTITTTSSAPPPSTFLCAIWPREHHSLFFPNNHFLQCRSLIMPSSRKVFVVIGYDADSPGLWHELERRDQPNSRNQSQTYLSGEITAQIGRRSRL